MTIQEFITRWDMTGWTLEQVAEILCALTPDAIAETLSISEGEANDLLLDAGEILDGVEG